MKKNKIKSRVAEYRTLPNNEKGLAEQRTELMLEINEIVEKAKAETRTLTDEEDKRFNEIKEEISKIDNTLKAIEENRNLQSEKQLTIKKEESIKEQEERAFDNFLRGKAEELRTGEIP